MNREPLLKLSASQEIEALLSDTALSHNNQNNWLLSYLDVFVLIIMLVITLLAITDFNTVTTKKQTKKTIANKPAKKNKEKSLKTCSKSLRAAASCARTERRNRNLHGVNEDFEHRPSANGSGAVDIEQVLTKIESKQLLIKSSSPSPKTIKYKTLPDQLPEKTTTATPIKTVKTTKKIIQAPEEVIKQPSSIPAAKEEIASKKPITALSTESRKKTNTWEQQLKNNLDHFDLNQFVNIKVRKGYAQIEIQDNVLFDSAQAQLTGEGQLLLEKLTGLLKQSDGVIFVEGHTDNQPIATANFPSNWELGSARATSVLHYLITQGISNQRLRAVTYADTMPLADNTTIEGRRKNRRVNLLVKLPAAKNAE